MSERVFRIVESSSDWWRFDLEEKCVLPFGIVWWRRVGRSDYADNLKSQAAELAKLPLYLTFKSNEEPK